MADFCTQCSMDVFGKDMRDMAGLSTEADTKKGLFPLLLCEGCGPVQVDHTGLRIHEPSFEPHQPLRDQGKPLVVAVPVT